MTAKNTAALSKKMAKPKAHTAPLDDMRQYRTLETVEALKLSFENHLRYTLARDQYSATDHDRYFALAMSVRDRLVGRWIQTNQTYVARNVKRVYYLSLEYLIGRAMGNNVINLGIDQIVSKAMAELGLDWNYLRDLERDAALGNGGLGRLAACFLDSLATHELPGYGYGIRYDYGIFRQAIRDGQQLEEPDNWLRDGNPWEIERPEYQFPVYFGGEVKDERDEQGRFVSRWINRDTVMGVPFDFPVAGYGNNTVNNLRLWTAKASEEFDLSFFNNGDYIRAYEQKILRENITKILYPNDRIEQGRELRFKQQYFFTSCSLQDILRRFKASNMDFRVLPDKVAIQLNDTHPSLAIAEMMRLLIDVHDLQWDLAWEITTHVFGYTNHTIMPEALEKWPVRLFEDLLPRHLTIIYEINRRFLRTVMNKFPDDHERLRRMSLVEEGPDKQVRMANLAVVGSHSVNGVAALHSELIKETLFRDFHDLWPSKFNNKTNGITQRRWLLKSNPALAALITKKIGDGWIKDLFQLKKLDRSLNDADFKARMRQIKLENKTRLADYIRVTNGIEVDPHSLFDVQVKRMHEYKRQLLNVLHILHRYCRIKENPGIELQARTFIFGGKAAPGYAMAKLIIKLINDVAGVVNDDPDVRGRMKVVFLSDYRVSLAERIIPACDLSEQISTAGMEASGTGNMKFALNGALTIGTLDGANIEIREEVGEDNFFTFGLTIDEVKTLRLAGYNPWDHYHDDPSIRHILDCLSGDFLNLEQPGLYRPIREALLEHGDYYLHLADFHSYLETQRRVDETYGNRDQWDRMCLMNIAHMGKFSSDRTILEYANEIWHIKPCPIDMPNARNG
ncbi:MAG: glycogen/starch/alpha-glucan phosphorylase [bacterium]